MTLKEYLKIKFEDEQVKLPLRAKIAIFLKNFVEMMRKPMLKSDLMC